MEIINFDTWNDRFRRSSVWNVRMVSAWLRSHTKKKPRIKQIDYTSHTIIINSPRRVFFEHQTIGFFLFLIFIPNTFTPLFQLHVYKSAPRRGKRVASTYTHRLFGYLLLIESVRYSKRGQCTRKTTLYYAEIYDDNNNNNNLRSGEREICLRRHGTKKIDSKRSCFKKN